MAKSIKLGADTYLDASGVVMSDHTKLDEAAVAGSGYRYFKLPDGTLIQTATHGEYSSGATKNYTINFPIPFLDYSYTVVACGGYGSDPTNYECIVTTKIVSKSQFEAHVRNATGNYTNRIYWIAIGKWK